MTTTKPHNLVETADEEHAPTLNDRLVEFLTQNMKQLAYAFICFIIALVALLQFMDNSRIQAQTDYLMAPIEMGRLQENIEALPAMAKILDAHPEIRPGYDGEVANTLLHKGEAAKAAPYIDSIFTRLGAEEGSPFQIFHDYTATTLLIEKGEYHAALQRAEALSEVLAVSDSNRSLEFKEAQKTLKALNLLRMATLYQTVEQAQDEIAAWQKFKTLFSLEKGEPTAEYQRIFGHFTVGSVSLIDFIVDREKKLG